MAPRFSPEVVQVGREMRRWLVDDVPKYFMIGTGFFMSLDYYHRKWHRVFFPVNKNKDPAANNISK